MMKETSKERHIFIFHHSGKSKAIKFKNYGDQYPHNRIMEEVRTFHTDSIDSFSAVLESVKSDTPSFIKEGIK